jgi:uncharacterized RDD family membrane protein YckC
MSILNKRIIATISDYIIYCAFFYVYVDIFGIEQVDGTKVVSGISALPVFVFWFGYFVIMEVSFGGTVGHLAFNLKVISVDGNDANFVQTLKRRVSDPLDFFLFGLPAYITAKNSPLSQRIGDMWAKTKVIEKVG